MNDRDTFASAALTGLLADDGDRIDHAMSDFIRRAYEWADAILLERGVWPEINRLCTERDEARREAYRQWLMRQCELEADRGTNIELRRLSKIYRDNFGGEYGDDSDAMLLERGCVACEPTKPTLTNDERAAIAYGVAALQSAGNYEKFAKDTLRKLLERTA